MSEILQISPVKETAHGKFKVSECTSSRPFMPPQCPFQRATTRLPRDAVMSIFRMACRLRFMKPDVDTLLRHINTQLDHMIVAALIEAALRLLPPDNTPEGKERLQKKMRDAQLAENSFTDQIRAMDYRFFTESEQKERNLQPTPDIRFLEPVSIHGKLCH